MLFKLCVYKLCKVKINVINCFKLWRKTAEITCLRTSCATLENETSLGSECQRLHIFIILTLQANLYDYLGLKEVERKSHQPNKITGRWNELQDRH